MIAELALLFLAGFLFAQWAMRHLLARYGGRFGLQGVADVASLPLLVAVFSLFMFAMTPVTNTIIRTQEIEADRFGLNLARDDFFKKELTFQVSSSYGPGRYDPNYEEKGQDYPVGYVRWTEQRNFEAVLDMMADGRLDVTPLISHRFSIEQAAEAYELVSGTGRSLGILLQYPGFACDPPTRTIRLQAPVAAPAASGVRAPAVSFVGSGNYATAVLMDRLGVPYWATLPVAALLCFALGFLMGFPALRLGGHYLALATFGLALAVPQLLKYKHIEGVTGGVQGIVLVKPEPPFSFRLFGQALNSDRWLYFFTLAVAALMFLLAWNLLRGRVGRALVAIRDHPIAATAMGINLPMFKSLTFGVSAGFTGVAGALGAIAVAFVSPDSFTVFLSLTFLIGVVIGGLASIPGAVFGALFIQFVPNIADELSKSAPSAIFGILLIAFMYLMPLGVMGIVRRIWARWRPGATRPQGQR